MISNLVEDTLRRVLGDAAKASGISLLNAEVTAQYIEQFHMKEMSIT